MLHAALVALVGGADVVVVGDAHALPEVLEGGGDLVGELLRRDSGGGGGALDLLAVLVGAGQEEGVVAQQAVAAGDDVGRDGGVGVADVRARVDVVDRRREVELFGGVWHRLGRPVYQGSRFEVPRFEVRGSERVEGSGHRPHLRREM